MRWSCGARGRVPRRAHRRVSLFCACRDGRPGSPPGAPGGFFENLRGLRVLRIVPRTRRELAEPERPQLPTDRRHAHRDPERFPEPLREVDQPPAHHPVAPGLGSGLHDLRQRRALVRFQRRSLAGRLAVDQTGRPLGVEAHNPVPDDLQPDATDPRRLRPGAAVPDRRKRQQPPNLLRVPTGAGQPTQVIASEVVSKLECSRHGKPRLFSTMNHAATALGIPFVSRAQRELV